MALQVLSTASLAKQVQAALEAPYGSLPIEAILQGRQPRLAMDTAGNTMMRVDSHFFLNDGTRTERGGLKFLDWSSWHQKLGLDLVRLPNRQVCLSQSNIRVAGPFNNAPKAFRRLFVTDAVVIGAQHYRIEGAEKIYPAENFIKKAPYFFESADLYGLHNKLFWSANLYEAAAQGFIRDQKLAQAELALMSAGKAMRNQSRTYWNNQVWLDSQMQAVRANHFFTEAAALAFESKAEFLKAKSSLQTKLKVGVVQFEKYRDDSKIELAAGVLRYMAQLVLKFEGTQNFDLEISFEKEPMRLTNVVDLYEAQAKVLMANGNIELALCSLNQASEDLEEVGDMAGAYYLIELAGDMAFESKIFSHAQSYYELVLELYQSAKNEVAVQQVLAKMIKLGMLSFTLLSEFNSDLSLLGGILT